MFAHNKPWWAIALVTGFAAVIGAAEAPRAARSVHLGYSAPEGDVFYNEVVVEQSTRGSYFMACGWNTGYFGIQELNSPTNRLVIFSVWDPTKGDDANKVPLDQRVEVLFEGAGTQVSRFGGEGTGGKCLWPHQWATNEVCRFLVQVTVAGTKTAYAGWFYDASARDWRHLVTFRTRTDGKPLRGYYSFVEDFRRDGRSVNDVRRARFGNGWVRTSADKWEPLTQARFTASSATWEAKENIDAGSTSDWFYLATGGETTRSRALGTSFARASSATNPPVNLPVLKELKTAR